MRLIFAALVLAGCSNDTFVSPDAGTDSGAVEAGSDAQACTPHAQGCASNAVCASFDDGTTGGFTAYVVGAASETVSPTLYVSCPNGLATRLDTIDAGPTDFFGGVVGSLSVPSTSDVTAKLTTEVVLPSNPAGGFLFFFSIAANQNTATSVSLAFISGTWQLRAGGNSASLDPLTGDWNPVTLKVHFTAGSSGTDGSAEIDYLDSSKSPQQKNVSIQTLNVASITSVQTTFGVGTLGGTTAPTLATYDDAVFSLN